MTRKVFVVGIGPVLRSVLLIVEGPLEVTGEGSLDNVGSVMVAEDLLAYGRKWYCNGR